MCRPTHGSGKQPNSEPTTAQALCNEHDSPYSIVPPTSTSTSYYYTAPTQRIVLIFGFFTPTSPTLRRHHGGVRGASPIQNRHTHSHDGISTFLRSVPDRIYICSPWLTPTHPLPLTHGQWGV
ncbi:unnamed protein product [Ectocarpus fasciculatus]